MDPKLAEIGPKVAEVGPKLAQVGPSWPKLAQVGPSWSKLAPSWPQVGSKSDKKTEPNEQGGGRDEQKGPVERAAVPSTSPGGYLGGQFWSIFGPF